MMKFNSTLKDLLLNDQLEPYIRHIRFPFFKNLSENSRIDFTHPLTVLVGQNGTNKSSVLRALFGSPNSYSLGSLWFSTAVDEIQDNGRSRFIYGYYDIPTNLIVEVIKTRIKKGTDPDYWEPSRPIIADGMDKMPTEILSHNQHSTRWKAINKNVLYLDFRANISAFDKFFYHSDFENQPKKDYLRKKSLCLKNIINEELKTFKPYKGKKEKLFKNTLISAEKVKIISEILGRNYTEIRILEHSIFTKDRAKTIILKSEHLNYSEAFAGSGEFSVAILVDSLLDCPKSSLILLDEPEVSLHPLAQIKLINFINNQIIKKKHQVIISTHSSSIVINLPNEAIKLFCLNETSGKIEILQNVSPEEAFFVLGDRIEKRTVIVEDKLAKKFVEKALRNSSEALLNSFDIKYFPGGFTSLYQNLALPLSIANVKDVLFLLDGDQNFENKSEPSINIPESMNGNLGSIIKEITNVDIKIHCDGSNGKSNQIQKISTQRKFLDFIHEKVNFLPMNTPEEFLLENLSGDYIDYRKNIDQKLTSPKEITCEICKLDLGDPNINSNDIFETQKRILSKIPNNNEKLEATRKLLQFFLENGKVR